MHKLAEAPIRNRAVMPSKIPVRITEPPMIRRRESAPSKLEQLAADFREKLYREKLKKLIHPYQNDSDRVLYETRGYGSAGNDGREGKHGLMREFFRERHALDEGYINNRQYQANIKYHYQKKKSEFYRGHSPGKPPLPHQNRSAGRDRSKPLAPIKKPSSGGHGQNGELNNGLTYSPKPPAVNKPQFIRNHYSASNSNGSQSPQPDLAKLPTDKALIPIGPNNPIPAISAYGSDQEYPESAGSGSGHQDNNRLLRKNSGRKIRQPRANIHRSPKVEHKRSQLPKPEAHQPDQLTSYQKWQMEQNNARTERLRQYHEQQEKQISNFEVSGYESDMSSTANASSRQNHQGQDRLALNEQKPNKKSVILKKAKPPSVHDEEDDVSAAIDEDEDDDQAELLRKQAELEALIEKQKHELEEMRRQRILEEENERHLQETRKKRIEAEQEHAKKQQELEDSTQSHLSRHSSQHDVSDGYESSVHSRQGQDVREPEPSIPSSSPAVPSSLVGRRRNSLPKKRRVEQRREPTPNNENTAFYLEMATTQDATGDLVLKPCPKCGRKFAEDRLSKHINVCQNASKKRKVFDPMKMRVKGTDFEQYAKKAAKAKREKTPPTKTWRTQHENFIRAIRYAKKVSDIESAGGNVADLPPPPPTENPNYKQCPYCERKFDPNVAERHIPRCKNIKARPAPPKQRRR